MRLRQRVFLAVAFSLACSLAVAQRPGSSSVRTLSGHVVDGNNRPLLKAVVYLKNTKTLVIKTYITDASGAYHFGALSPNADYEVYADHQGSRSDTKTLSAFDNRKQFEVTLKIRDGR